MPSTDTGSSSCATLFQSRRACAGEQPSHSARRAGVEGPWQCRNFRTNSLSASGGVSGARPSQLRNDAKVGLPPRRQPNTTRPEKEQGRSRNDTAAPPTVCRSGAPYMEGAFQRVESLVAAVWSFSDLILLAGLLQGMKRIVGVLLPKASPHAAAVMLLASAGVVGLAAFPNSAIPEALGRGAVLWGNLLLALALPLLAVVVKWFRH